MIRQNQDGKQANPRAARRWLRARSFLVLASTCLACLFAEVSLRLLWHNPYAHDGPDRVVKLRLQHANTHHRVNRSAIHPESPHTLLRTDDRSYILPSFQYSDADLTIAFLGGSTTECCAVAESVRFPALVSTKLAKAGLNVNTLNSGASGNTLHDSINIFLNHVVQDEPDVAVLMHACNDIGLLHETRSYASRSAEYLGWFDVVRSTLMRLTNRSYLLAITRQVLKEHTHYVPVAPEDVAVRRIGGPSKELDGAYEIRLRTFVRICRAFHVTPVIMTQPMSGQFTLLTPDWVDQDVQVRFNEIIRRVGREEGATVIDLVAHLQQEVPDWRTHMNVFYDGVHVTDQGSQIYGNFISDQLLRLLYPADSTGAATDAEVPVLSKLPLERR